jgi:hypothetical protein
MSRTKYTRLLVVTTLVCVCAPYAGCGSGETNSPIVIGPYELTPRSGLVYESPDGEWAVVIVSDQPNICALYQGAQCSIEQVGPPPGNNLIMVFNGSSDRQYSVYEALAYENRGGGAQARPTTSPMGLGGRYPRLRLFFSSLLREKCSWVWRW